MKRRVGSVVLALLLLGLCLVGCGGTSGDPLERDEWNPGDTGPARPTDCAANSQLDLLLIDDFELGAATGAFTNNEVCDDCRDLEGEELFACQDLCVASQDPTDYDKPLPAELIPGGRCGSRYALHITTESFHHWGGIVGFPFAPAIDARDYDGVAFWGRIAWGTRSTVRASVLDPETDATFVDPRTGETRCEGASTLDVFQEVCDAYGGYAVMTGDWQLFTVPFEEMRQRGYGHVASYLDVGSILQVSIEYGMGAWDFWIDDLAFYRVREGEK